MQTSEYRRKLAEEFARLLEEKELDWKQEWRMNELPVNAASDRAYHGINQFKLMLTAMTRGYEDPRWATFHQVKGRGWKLKNAKGQGVPIEYWFPYDTEDKKELSWQEFYKRDGRIGERYVLHTKYYTVFNASLIEGIEPFRKETGQEIQPDELVGKLSERMEVPIRNDGGDQAYYSRAEDMIHLPEMENFYTSYAYNSTALHELTHATGAQHRLNRNMGALGTPGYAFEELVAEITSCFMSEHLQLEQNEQHIENHKAYVQSWAEMIREEPDVLARAIRQAEKATGYMEYHAELITKEEYDKILHSSAKVDEKYAVESPLELADDTQRLRVENAYHVGGNKYLYLQGSEDGYDYTLYDYTFREIDGGRFTNQEISAEEAKEEILTLHELAGETTEQIPIEEYERLPELLYKEPTVTVTFTESDRIEEGKAMPFSEADSLFEKVDRETREYYGENRYYDKTGFVIEYMRDGRLCTYTGRQDMGDLDGSLTDHILQNAVYGQDDIGYLHLSAEQEKELKAQYEDTIHSFVPYLKTHKNLTAMENGAAVIVSAAGGNRDYYKAVMDFVKKSRAELNGAAVPELPEIPELEDYMEPITEEYRERVESEIEQEARAAGMTVEEYAANDYEPYPSDNVDQERAQETFPQPENPDLPAVQVIGELSALSETPQNETAGQEPYTETIFRGIWEMLKEIKASNHYYQEIMTIWQYEMSIGRTESVIGRMGEEQMRQYAVRCERYLAFGHEVDQCLAGELNARNAIRVCDTPKLMLQAGCRPLPMHITQKHLKDCISDKSPGQPHYHGLTLEEIKRLPEELEKPAVMAKSPTRADSIVVILGYKEQDGLPILVSVVPNGNATYDLQRLESNFITSVYGKGNVQEYIQRSLEKGQIIYINKEKSQKLALLPLQLRQDHPAPAFDSIIQRIDSGVKPQNAEKTDLLQQIGRAKNAERVKEFVPRL